MCKIVSDYNEKIENGAKWTSEYNEFLTKAQLRKQELGKAISEIDLQRQDLLHYIEMKKCDASVSARIMKRLKEISQERRILKDEFAALNSIGALSKKSKYKNNSTYEFKTTVITDLLEDIVNEA